MTTTTKDKVETFVEYTFKEVGLSGYSAGAGSDDAPQREPVAQLLGGDLEVHRP